MISQISVQLLKLVSSPRQSGAAGETKAGVESRRVVAVNPNWSPPKLKSHGYHRINMLKKSLLSAIKGTGILVYSYCLCYTITHHMISYVVVSIIILSLCTDSL